MLYRVTAIHWQHTDILLRCTKPNANIAIGNILDISFKHHFIGNIIFVYVPFIQNNRVSLPEIGQSISIRMHTFQHQIRFMDIRCTILPYHQII